jgi:xyloglucan-specific exo-beta-1,4-glucanase
MITSYWGAYGEIKSDRVADGVFYCLNRYGLYVSKDKGAHFDKIEGIPGKGTIVPLPYHEGEIWYGNNEGMFRSTDFGAHFEKVTDFEEVYAFDFGKGLHHNECALYVYGKIEGQVGKFRSDDYGKTFVCIDDGLARGRASGLCADRKVYGRIYMSSGGRGFYYAEPVKE